MVIQPATLLIFLKIELFCWYFPGNSNRVTEYLNSLFYKNNFIITAVNFIRAWNLKI